MMYNKCDLSAKVVAMFIRNIEYQQLMYNIKLYGQHVPMSVPLVYFLYVHISFFDFCQNLLHCDNVY